MRQNREYTDAIYISLGFTMGENKLTTQNNTASTTETASTEHFHDISDNGSVILGWLVIAIMVIFVAMNVVTHEPERVDMVESNNIKSSGSEQQEVKGVTHSIDENKPRIIIEADENLIHTRLQI